MKLHSVLRYRLLIFVGMLLLAFSFEAIDQLFFGSSLQAQTATPEPTSTPPTTEQPLPIITTPTGLKYVDLAPGTGPAAKTGDTLVVNYDGKLGDGTKFDSTYDRDEPMKVVLGVTDLIAGWTEGLAGMKAGQKRRLIIPSQLGYGLKGFGKLIPPNSTLIFTIEIVAINPK